jgi:hypothetical protein
MTIKKEDQVTNLPANQTDSQLPAEYADMLAADANVGLAKNAEDYAIPFLVIAQKGSPQVNRNKAEYMAGLETGYVFNTVTGEIFNDVIISPQNSSPKGLVVVPVAYERKKIEWKNRETGNGGLVAIHGPDYNPPTTRDHKGRDVLINGNVLVDTAQHYVLLVDLANGFYEQAMISMASTQLKKSRTWNSLMSNVRLQGTNGLFTPPSFASMYKLSTVYEDNDKGDWYGWKIDRIGFIDMKTHKHIYEAAKKFHEAIMAGQVKVSEPVLDGTKSAFSDNDNVM